MASIRTISEADHYDRVAAGIEIREARSKLHMSIERLSEAAGMAPATLRKFEKGKYTQHFKMIYKSCSNALKIEELARKNIK